MMHWLSGLDFVIRLYAVERLCGGPLDGSTELHGVVFLCDPDDSGFFWGALLVVVVAISIAWVFIRRPLSSRETVHGGEQP